MQSNEFRNRYEDIIGLPHYVSKTRPQMDVCNRAAQFSPFAALTGYEAVIEETGRLTNMLVELDEGKKDNLNEKLQYLLEHMKEKPKVNITYFQPDENKEGGEYVEVMGTIKKIDDYNHCIVLNDDLIIKFMYLYEITITEDYGEGMKY